MIWHILPTNDLEDHIDSSTCHCQPLTEVLADGDLLIIHSSFDGREGVEWAKEILCDS